MCRATRGTSDTILDLWHFFFRINLAGCLVNKYSHLNMSGLKKRVSHHSVGESDNGVYMNLYFWRVRICDREEGREHRFLTCNDNIIRYKGLIRP